MNDTTTSLTPEMRPTPSVFSEDELREVARLYQHYPIQHVVPRLLATIESFYNENDSLRAELDHAVAEEREACCDIVVRQIAAADFHGVRVRTCDITSQIRARGAKESQ